MNRLLCTLVFLSIAHATYASVSWYVRVNNRGKQEATFGTITAAKCFTSSSLSRVDKRLDWPVPSLKFRRFSVTEIEDDNECNAKTNKYIKFMVAGHEAVIGSDFAEGPDPAVKRKCYASWDNLPMSAMCGSYAGYDPGSANINVDVDYKPSN